MTRLNFSQLSFTLILSQLIFTTQAMAETGKVAPVADTIYVMAEERHNASNEDGTGLYWDLLREVFEPIGIKILHYTTGFNRASGLVRSQVADAVIGVYKNEFPDLVYPKWHLDSDVISAVYRKDRFPDWTGESMMQGNHVAWQKGYQLENYINAGMKVHRVWEKEKMLQLVASGEIDIFINAKFDIDTELAKGYVDPKQLSVATFKALPLYVAFTNTMQGHILAKTFDQRFEEILQKGSVASLHQKWNWNRFPYDTRNMAVIEPQTLD